MSLSRFKAKIQTQAVRVFSDREVARKAFHYRLEEYSSNLNGLCVLNFYGIGGIGKSHLLRYLCNTLVSQPKIATAYVDVESTHYGSQVDFLLDIRRQLHVDAPLFDYAVARLLCISGRSLHDLDRRWLPENSLLYDLLELGSELAEVVAPARLIGRLWGRLSDAKLKKFSAISNEFKTIDSLSDTDLSASLPYFLGVAIGHDVKARKRPVVIFIDSIETLSIRNYFLITKENPDTWLRELIAAAETGLWVLAGRNFLRWVEEEPLWGEYLEQHTLGSLSDEDADYFLKSIPINEECIRKAIIESAKGVPLYLDLCASTYLIRKDEGCSLTDLDFKFHEKEVISQFLAHLDKEHRECIRALATISSFDAKLFNEINLKLNISIPIALFEDFCSSSYVESEGSVSELYSVHRLVREYVRDGISAKIKGLIAEVVARECISALDNGYVMRAITLLRDFVDLLPYCSINLHVDFLDYFIDASVRLINQGYWVDVDDAISNLESTPDMAPSLCSAISFLRGFCARKQGRLHEALQAHLSAYDGATHLGRFSSLLSFHLAHTRHLLGDYELAEEEYKRLAHTTAGGQNQPVVLLAHRQMADIDMLRGRFRAARERFDSLIGGFPFDPLWDAETHRFRGHVRRFTFQLNEAEKCYMDALRIAQSLNADAMLGKVYTNLAETLCWYQPDEAIRNAEKAIQLNLDVAAPIEVGKALAAKSIAYAKSGQPSRGRELAAMALSCQEKTSYLSGKLFALLALGISCAAEGNRLGVETAYLDLFNLSNNLGVYKFLNEPLRLILLGESYSLPSEFEWLDDAALRRMMAVLPFLS